MADDGRRLTDRFVGRPSRRHAAGRSSGASKRSAEPARGACICVRGKNAGLCSGSASRILRFSGHPQDCAGIRATRVPLVVVNLSYHPEHAVSDEEVAKAMMIFKKVIPRRTFIRGLGVTLGVPLLDAMKPALAATAKPLKRFSIVYVPNGRIMQQWTPPP